MYRWKVVRSYVYHKKKIYRAGELMPENFTDRDRAHNTYSRRLEKVFIPSGPTSISTEVKATDTIVESKEVEVKTEDSNLKENLYIRENEQSYQELVPSVDQLKVPSENKSANGTLTINTEATPEVIEKLATNIIDTVSKPKAPGGIKKLVFGK